MKKISVEFDGTLSRFFNGMSNPMEMDVQHMVKRLIDEGHDVHIVTRRYENQMLSENRAVLQMGEHLGLSDENIHFTNRNWKWQILDELGIDFHLDNDETDLYYIKNKLTKTIGVSLNKDGVQKFYDLVNKIEKDENKDPRKSTSH